MRFDILMEFFCACHNKIGGRGGVRSIVVDLCYVDLEIINWKLLSYGK